MIDSAMLLNAIIALVSALLGASGLWAYIGKRLEAKIALSNKQEQDRKAERNLLVGLAHDRIMCLGMNYIERGYITSDEYENINDYLFIPYEKCGGNGSAKKIMHEVRELPLHK